MLLIVTLFSGVILLPSDTQAEETDLKGGIGLSAGLASGSGFSVRIFPQKGFGWQATGVYLRSEDNVRFNLGAESLYILRRDDKTALYLVGGLSYLVRRDDDEVWEYDRSVRDEIKVIKRDREYGVGVGIGLGGALVVDQLLMSIELVMTGYHNTIRPLPQISIHYLLW